MKLEYIIEQIENASKAEIKRVAHGVIVGKSKKLS